MARERWKTVQGYEEYQISNLGRVRRVVKRIIAPAVAANGYLVVSLFTKRKRKQFKIHRLVARAFIGKPSHKKPYVNHKDLNKINNRQSNLQYVSAKDNARHYHDAARRALQSQLRLR